MSAKVVCFSASDGAAGEEVALLVARDLRYRLIDEQVIARAAETSGLGHRVVAGAEARMSIAARIAEQLPAAGIALGTSGLAGFPALTAGELLPESHRLRGLIRDAIEEIAAKGDVVIVAHAASLALGPRSETLRVFTTASPQTRRIRLAASQGIGDKEADRLLTKGDRNRADYLKRFYGVSAELPSHYDLVLNTDQLSPEQAAKVIVQAAAG
jgi:hypothetical protein